MNIQADYLVVGAGAMGMAFTDVLMTETDATVAIVDAHHAPGGHWNDAYPFVRLHQPSAFYGVNSRSLGSDTIDRTGWNAGLYELATSGEVCAYFDQVMQQQFLPSKRVQYFPMSRFLGDGQFESLVTGERHRVESRKTVDATYMNVTVPSVTTPRYLIGRGVRCVPPNDLPRLASKDDDFVVIGAGKTGMDACLWLLRNTVDPKRIRWIMPRDSWLLDRANIQPASLFMQSLTGFARQNESIAKATSVESMFDGLNACGQLLRFDESIRPTMYRCATVTRAELDQLRRIDNVVRMGRVQRIDADAIVLDEGTVSINPQTLCIDCSADGLARRPVVPVFQADTITLQAVRTCQQVFSAAFIGHVEAAYTDMAEQNRLCAPVPHPDSDIDFLRTALANSLNQVAWAADTDLQDWLQAARLDGFSLLRTALTDASAELPFTVESLQQNLFASINNLHGFLAEIDGTRGQSN